MIENLRGILEPFESSSQKAESGEVARKGESNRDNAESVDLTFGGDLPSVVRNFVEKRSRIEQGDKSHEEIATVLILGPGRTRGVCTAGVAEALSSSGLLKRTHIIGVSSGAISAMAIAMDAADRFGRIFFEKNPYLELINKKRLIKGIFDTRGLERCLRTIVTEEDIGVTNLDTAAPNFFSSRDRSADPISALVATINMVLISSLGHVEIKGEKYVDGAYADPLPINYAIKKLNATDIIVVTPDPLTEKKKNGIAEPLIELYRNARLKPPIDEKVLSWTDRQKAKLAFALDSGQWPKGVKIGVIYPRQISIGQYSTDHGEQKTTHHAALSQTRKMLEDIVKN